MTPHQLIHPGTIAKKELEARDLIFHQICIDSPSLKNFLSGFDLTDQAVKVLGILLPDITPEFWRSLQSNYAAHKAQVIIRVKDQMSREAQINADMLRRYVAKHPLLAPEISNFYEELYDSREEHY